MTPPGLSRLERAAERDPGLYPFGTRPLKQLSAREERDANFEDRLKSVWRYIVKRSVRFTATLSERERAHLHAEDLVSEVVAALIERDPKWDWTRGRYVTFVERILRNVLSIKREQARIVIAPSNASGRLRRYKQQEAEGKLSPGAALTMRAIEAAMGEVEKVGPGSDPAFGDRRKVGDEPDPRSKATALVVAALRELTDFKQAHVLGQSYGLFTGQEYTAQEIAASSGADVKAVRSLQDRARSAMRRRIERMQKEPPS